MRKSKYEVIGLSKLNPSTYNPRIMPDNEMAKLMQSMQEWGCCQPLVVNKDGTIIGGHQRFEAAKSLGWKEISVIRLDISKNEEKLLNLALNRIHGEWDEEKLSELLAELRKDESLDELLSGFSEVEIDKLLGEFESANSVDAEYVGMPGYDHENVDAFQSVIVHFDSAQDVEAFAKLVKQKITNKTKYLWFPEHKKEKRAGKVWVEASGK